MLPLALLVLWRRCCCYTHAASLLPSNTTISNNNTHTHTTTTTIVKVRAPAEDSDDYVAWRAATDLRAPYRLDPLFLRGTRRTPGPELFDQGEAPLIAFINAKSGGRAGPALAQVLARALGTSQVFDLSENNPSRVLRALWRNLEQQEAAGSAAAARARRRLRVLVCGGDGTVAWLLKVIRDLGLSPPPPVAILPLGTGNDLSRSFDWGAAFMPRWIRGHAGVYATLKRVADAKPAALDVWGIRVTVPGRGHRMPHTYALAEVDPAVEVPVTPFAARHGHWSPHPSGGGAPPGGGGGGATTAFMSPGSAASLGGQRGGGSHGGSLLGVAAAAAAAAAVGQDAASDAGASAAPSASAASAAGGAGASSGARGAGHELESNAATLGSLPGSGPSSASLASGAPPPPRAAGAGATGATAPASTGGGASSAAAATDPLADGADDDDHHPYAALAYAGSFFNYFSIGGDAQAAHGFHSLRERRPGLAGSRLANQFWYSWFSCSSGWFCNALPSVSAFSSAEVLRGGEWRRLAIPPAVKALVIVNLQSYGGGRNLWGERQAGGSSGGGSGGGGSGGGGGGGSGSGGGSSGGDGFRAPAPDDGLIELVGFTHGWQAMAVMATRAKAAHALRLAQGEGLRLTLRGGGGPDGGGAPATAYLQLDGEPWQQPLPAGESAPPVVVEVFRRGRVPVLRNVADARQKVRRMSEVLPAGSSRFTYLKGGTGAASGGGGGGGGGGSRGAGSRGRGGERQPQVAAAAAAGS